MRTVRNSLAPPESDFKIAIVEAGKAASGKDAAAAAWELYRPKSVHPLKLETERPGREGWEASSTIFYETSPTSIWQLRRS